MLDEALFDLSKAGSIVETGVRVGDGVGGLVVGFGFAEFEGLKLTEGELVNGGKGVGDGVGVFSTGAEGIEEAAVLSETEDGAAVMITKDGVPVMFDAEVGEMVTGNCGAVVPVNSKVGAPVLADDGCVITGAETAVGISVSSDDDGAAVDINNGIALPADVGDGEEVLSACDHTEVDDARNSRKAAPQREVELFAAIGNTVVVARVKLLVSYDVCGERKKEDP